MSTAAGLRNGSVSKRAQAEAAAWVIRLHGPERNTAMESGWRCWLREHPDHLAAWERASDTWNETHDIPFALVHPPVRGPHCAPKGRFRPILIALAAAASIVVALVLHFTGGTPVTTAVGEQRSLTLDDGTRIELNTDSHLTVQYDERTRKVSLRSGEAYFEVAPEHRPFIVVAGERQIVALGTTFTVRHDQTAGDPLTVTLIEGRVAVAPVGANLPHTLPPGPMPEVTLLRSGERLTVRARTAAAIIDAPSIDKVTAWTRGQVVFDSVFLGEAVNELNRYSHIKVALAAPELAHLPVGGIFRAGDSKSFARAVAETYNLTLTRHADEIILAPALP